MSLNILKLGLVPLGIFCIASCQSGQRTEELIRARLNEEKVKTLTTEVVELKRENAVLTLANKELNTQLLVLQSAKVHTEIAPNKPAAKKSTATGANHSPAEVAAAREQLTGGGSFK